MEVVKAHYKSFREKRCSEKANTNNRTTSGAKDVLEKDISELYESLHFFGDVLLPKISARNSVVPVTAADVTVEDVKNIKRELLSPVDSMLMRYADSDISVTPKPKRHKSSQEYTRRTRSRVPQKMLSVRKTTTNRLGPQLVAKPKLSRFDYLGKYIAGALSALNPNEANIKANKIMNILHI